MQDQVMKKFAAFQDVASPIRPDSVPMLKALQRMQTYQDFHLQQQDTVNLKTETVNHLLAQMEFVQDWNGPEASTYISYGDRLLQLYNELSPAREELRCIEQVLLPDVLEQAVGPLNQKGLGVLALKDVVTDQIKSLGSRLAELGIRPAQPVRRRLGERAEDFIDTLVDWMQEVTFLGQEMRQRSKTADGNTLTYEDESRQEARLIRNSIKFEEGNLVQHQAWVRGWDIVAYNESARSFMTQGARRDQHVAAAVLAQSNARKAGSDVDTTEQHLRHLKWQYVRKNKMRFSDPYSHQTILGRRKFLDEFRDRYGNKRRRRNLGTPTRERILERRILGERLAMWFLEPDPADDRDSPEYEEVDSRSGSEASTTLKRPRTASQTARAASQQPQGFEHLRHRIPLDDGQPESSSQAGQRLGTSIAAAGSSTAASTKPTRPRPTTGGLRLPRSAAHPPLSPTSPPRHPPPSPQPPLPPPVITPAEARRRIILDSSPSPDSEDPPRPPSPSNPAPSPFAPPAAAPTQPILPSAASVPAQPPSSSHAGPRNASKRKRGDDDQESGPPAAKSTSQAGRSSKRARQQEGQGVVTTAPTNPAPAPASTPAPAPVVPNTAAPTNAAPATRYVRGGVKSTFLKNAEALPNDVAPDGRTRRSGRISRRRGA